MCDHLTIINQNLGKNYVAAHVFNQNGKWKYDVTLEYVREDWDRADLHEVAREALARATENKVSGVVFRNLTPGWTMFVPEPYGRYSYPVMIVGSL